MIYDDPLIAIIITTMITIVWFAGIFLMTYILLHAIFVSKKADYKPPLLVRMATKTFDKPKTVSEARKLIEDNKVSIFKKPKKKDILKDNDKGDK